MNGQQGKKAAPPGQACPCGGGAFDQCCGPFIGGQAIAPTAAQLMRSRYSAYVLENDAYLRATWHASTRPTEPMAEPGLTWLGLEVRAAREEGAQATVEFVARCKRGGRAQRMQETSQFVREDGRWFYVDGRFTKD